MAQQLMVKANFQFCTNGNCAFSEDLHLLVTKEIAEIKRDNAVAISYTWGEFNRRAAPIGHDAHGAAVNLTLGEEWNSGDFATRLQEICLEANGCWIDQVCIPQKDDEIRTTLAAIPDIYRTLDVTALLPNAPCKCLIEAAAVADKNADALKHVRSSRTEAEHRLADREIGTEWWSLTSKCFNALPCTSWFTRLWTRQELQYSSRIRTAYATNETSPCFAVDFQNAQDCSLFKDDRDIHLLQPYLALTFKKALASGASRASAMRAVGNSITSSSIPALQAISDYLGMANTSNQMLGAARLCHFYAGTELEKYQPSNTLNNDNEKIYAFMDQLVRLGAARRIATQERDYVVAVWVDCPGYVLPPNYKTMSLAELLDDALSQLQTKFAASPVVHAPSGLFGQCVESSGLWKPSKYIPRSSIGHSGSIYGVLSSPAGITPFGKGFELDRWIVGTTAVSKVGTPFQQLFDGKSTAAVFEEMARIATGWTSDTIQGQALKYAMNFKRQSADAVTEGPEDIFRSALIDGMDSGKVNSQWIGDDIDPYPVIYRMVTDMLGLDYNLCRDEGLVLMVSLQTSCIGLLTAAAAANTQKNATILVSVLASGCLAFEGEEVQTSPPLPVPTYRICGVWVPTTKLPLLNANFVQRPGGRQGYVI